MQWRFKTQERRTEKVVKMAGQARTTAAKRKFNSEFHIVTERRQKGLMKSKTSLTLRGIIIHT